MSNEDWAVNGDDLQGGTGKAKPVRTYTTRIASADTAKDTNGRLYIKLVLDIALGSEKGGKLWENYLPLGRDTKGKNAGKINARTSSFLKAIAHSNGIPAGAPGGPDISTLVGTMVDVKNENSYEVEGEQYPIRTWEKKYKEYKAAGKLDGIDPRDDLGFYSLSDEFEGVGGGSADDAADDDGWG